VKQAGVQVAAFGTGMVLPSVAAASGWRSAMGWSATLPVALLVAVWRLVPAREPRPAAERRWRWPIPSRWLRWLVGYSLLLGAGAAAVTTYLSLYAVQRLGLSEWAGGVLLAAFGVTGLVSRVLWGRWADRLANVTVALAWLPGAAIGAVLLVWAAGPVWAGLVWLGAVGVGGSATAANAVSMLAVVRRGGATGHASGLVSVGFFGGFVVGPALFGVVADGYGYAWAWPLVAALFAGAALTSLRVRALYGQPVTA
jgi:predicted MFS family arabinose efflux permease